MKLIVILSIKKKDFFKYRTDVEKKEQLKEIWDYWRTINRIITRDKKFRKFQSDYKFEKTVIHAYDTISDENIWSIWQIIFPIKRKLNI
jgi:uncharacterized FlaG/YvyC family protein